MVDTEYHEGVKVSIPQGGLGIKMLRNDRSESYHIDILVSFIFLPQKLVGSDGVFDVSNVVLDHRSRHLVYLLELPVDRGRLLQVVIPYLFFSGSEISIERLEVPNLHIH